MSNIAIAKTETGVLRAQVVRSRRITPHLHRVTLTGPDLQRLEWRGFDQWVRLFLPPAGSTDLDRVPHRFTVASYLRLKLIPEHSRPVVRNYTLREWRPETGEVDIDFVVHGDHGVAGPWAVAAQAGDVVAMLDQGCGWPNPSAGQVLLTGDESGLPAIAGILRDLPAPTRGLAMIEVLEEEDRLELAAPEGVEVCWLARGNRAPGALLLPELERRELPAEDRHAFAVGESALATGVRRQLVRERGWEKAQVTFCGYWKQGAAR